MLLRKRFPVNFYLRDLRFQINFKCKKPVGSLFMPLSLGVENTRYKLGTGFHVRHPVLSGHV